MKVGAVIRGFQGSYGTPMSIKGDPDNIDADPSQVGSTFINPLDPDKHFQKLSRTALFI